MKQTSKLNKEFRRIYITDNLSFIMNKILLFCMPLWVMETTRSSFVLSVYNSAVLLTTVILSPLSGILSDKYNKVHIIRIGNVIKMISSIAVFLAFTDSKKYDMVIIVLFLIRYSCVTLINPNTSSLIVHIVKKEQLEQAVYVQQVTKQLLQILVPSFAGFLISFITYRQVYLLDVVMVGIVLCLLGGVTYSGVKKADRQLETDNVKEHAGKSQGFSIKSWNVFWHELSAKLSQSENFGKNGRNIIAVFLACAAVVNVLGACITLSMQVYIVEAEVQKGLVGILMASSPLGGLIGSVMAKKVGFDKLRIPRAMFYVSMMGVFNLFMGIAACGNQIQAFIFFYFVSGIFFGLSNVQFGIFYKKYIPAEIQGRFFGILNSVLLIATPVGNTVNGVLLGFIDAEISIVFLGALTCVSGLLFMSLTRDR